MNPRMNPAERWLIAHRRHALGLAGALGGMLALCWVVIQTNGYFPGDESARSWLAHWHHTSAPIALYGKAFAALGDPVVACVSVAIAWLVVDRYVSPRHALLVFAAVGAVGVNAILKGIIGATPLQLSIRGPYASANFPSGHVTYATSLFGVLAWFALGAGKRKTFAVLVAAALAMGPARIIDKAHWPSDVLAGYALGLAWTILVLVLGGSWAAGLQRPERRRAL
ncbi:MAG TPA: phosphatase PAP2 family protein [Solirubrobacteraceae bacterium]|jgi:undecaprenyl-diphosphatase